jgi:hypothetical protein
MSRRADQQFVIDAALADFASFHIDLQELDHLVAEYGVDCLLRRAVRCPCVRIETRQARISCPACNGLGFAHPEALEESLRALVLNRSSSKRMLPPGETHDGQAVITFPLGITPSIGDQVWPAGETHVVQELIFRAARQVDLVAMRARSTDQDDDPPRGALREDRLLYPDVVTIDSVCWFDGERLVFAGQADYRRRPLGRIEWSGTAGPPPGSAYSVRYTAPAAYQVFTVEPVFRGGGQGAGYPYRVTAIALHKLSDRDLR